jgi:hypothetical protein
MPGEIKTIGIISLKTSGDGKLDNSPLLTETTKSIPENIEINLSKIALV